MSRKVFNYVSAIVTAVGSVAEASAVFFGWGAAISASIPVVIGAIITVMGNFVKAEVIEEKK